MSWYYYLAFKQLFPTGKRFSFFALMAIIGVSLGVMVLLIVQTVMNGFSEQIREAVRKSGGDVRIYVSGGGILYKWEDLAKEIKKYDFIEAIAPNVYGMLMLKYNNLTEFPAVRGIDYDLEDQAVPIRDYIIEGNLEDLDDETVILSSGLAKSIGASIGSKIEVYTPLMLERMKDHEVLLPRELEVVGIFSSGWGEIDKSFMLASLRLTQELYAYGDGVSSLVAKFAPGVDNERAGSILKKDFEPKGFTVSTWIDANEGQLFVLRMEKNMMFFIIIFIILVASFSIASSLMTSVVRKIKEIGLLASMGARSVHIAVCYCAQGLFIGVVGAILGTIGGIIAIQFRNEIVHAIAGVTQREEVLIQFYQFQSVPAHYMVSDFVIVIFCSIAIATLAALFPAIKAARLKPAEALRNE